MAETIEAADIKFSPFSVADRGGKVFAWRGRLFRAIRPEHVAHITRLFSCGLIDDLVKRGLFPKSWMTEYQLEGFGMVIEHERIESVSYPFEWSFLMFRDAARLVLQVEQIARDYGYQLTDCHGFNVLFDGNSPRFVDLGSFGLRSDTRGFWRAHDEFLRFYLYPLRLWSAGDGYVARRMLLGSELWTHESYLCWRFPLLRAFRGNWLRRSIDRYYKYRGVAQYSPDEIRLRLQGVLGRVLAGLRARHLLPLQSVNLEALARRIGRISRSPARTRWGIYHQQIDLDPDSPASRRIDRIVEIVGQHRIRTVVDLAGNQGLVARRLLARDPGLRAVCIDSDENAVDRAYTTVPPGEQRLLPLLADFVFPLVTYRGETLSERVRGDLALALAITHHLILSNGLAIETVLETIASYTRQFVAIEFMPLGLFDGASAPPVPSWYTVEWFRENFCKYFELDREEQLDANRVLFFGRLRVARQGGVRGQSGPPGE